MSALAVAFSLKGERDPVELTSILIEAQSDRGPDETSQWSDAGVSLAVSHLFRSPGHRVQDHRVHTTVEDCIVAWDGRLDNRRELLAALGLPADEVIADAAELARGWTAWGRALPERLRGDFAFVLWDVSGSRCSSLRAIRSERGPCTTSRAAITSRWRAMTRR
jgi:asparagine synthetase B (glutamine-hydrolysing)